MWSFHSLTISFKEQNLLWMRSSFSVCSFMDHAFDLRGISLTRIGRIEEDLHQNSIMLASWSQTSNLQNYQQYISVYKLPSLWYFYSSLSGLRQKGWVRTLSPLCLGVQWEGLGWDESGSCVGWWWWIKADMGISDFLYSPVSHFYVCNSCFWLNSHEYPTIYHFLFSILKHSPGMHVAGRWY